MLRRQGALVQILCNHGSTKQFKSEYKEVEMARLHQQMFFISVLHLLTLLGWLRFGFSAGHDRTLHFRDSPRIFEF